MAIIKKILNIFKSGNREEEEARLRAQKERYDNFLDSDQRRSRYPLECRPLSRRSRGTIHRTTYQRT